MLGQGMLGQEMVGGSELVTTGDSGAIACRTTVTGNLTASRGLAGSVSGHTAVTGRIGLKYAAAGNIACRTAVTGTAFVSVLNPNAIHGSTTVTGSLVLQEALTGAIHARTIVTGRIIEALALTGSINARTTVSGTLIRLYFGTGSIAGSTTVTGALETHDLNGAIHARTITTGFLNLAELLTGRTCAGTTSVHASLSIANSPFFGAISGSTTVRGLMYISPQDSFGRITGRTSVTGVAYVSLHINAAVHARTTINGTITGIRIVAGTIHCKTVVAAKVRNGFGADLFCTTNVILPRLSFSPMILTGRNIAARTIVNASSLINPWSGRAVCRSTVSGTIRLAFGLVPRNVIAGVTKLHSIIYWDRSGRNPPRIGPDGFVTLTDLPMGDLGLPSIIDTRTTTTGALLDLRHRQLTFYGSVGLQSPGRLTWVGDMARGTGTRGSSSLDSDKVLATAGSERQRTYFV